MRFRGPAFRAHNPRWSYLALSGAGAAEQGGRFNPKGVETLYLSLDLKTAISEASQNLPLARMKPLTLCVYDIDCDDLVDLRTDAGRTTAGARLEDMVCAWSWLLDEGKEPPSWALARRFIAEGRAGILVPSFVRGAGDGDHNLVLWIWSDQPPHRVTVFDPDDRLPGSAISWR